jgi:hypothetical protein
MSRIHEDATPAGAILSLGLCGISLTADRVTTDRGIVTCRICRRRRAAADRDANPWAHLSPAACARVGEVRDVVPGRREPVDVYASGQTAWSSPRAALHALAVAMDDGYESRSVSDPQRLLAAGIRSTGAKPSGDSGQRHVERLHAVHRALELSFTEPWRDDRGGLEVPPDLARRVLVLIHAGRPVGRRKAGGKHVVIERVEVSGDEAAEWLSGQVGRVVTPRSVMLLRREGWRRFVAYLASRGLVAAMRRREGDVQPWDLETWPQIAGAMGKSEGWCRKMSERAEDPLPVTHVGAISRVVAVRAELEDWWVREFARARGGTGGEAA